MTDSGLEVERRLAALRHARDALMTLRVLLRQRILMESTRADAGLLGQIVRSIENVVLVLDHAGGEHWALGPTLMGVVKALDTIDGADSARVDVQACYDEILGQLDRG